MNNILINIIIGLIVVIGFFIYWGNAEGWFKKGGFVYEWWYERHPKKEKKKKDDNEEE